MSATVSIVLATYNGETYIADQLESLRRQTHLPFELIISDDESSDGTYEIIREFADTAPFPVKIIRNSPRKGFQENFLHAAAQAQGEWVAFCDQDDIWSPEKLSRCASAPVTEDVTMIVHQAVLIDADGKIIREFNQGISASCVRGALYYYPWRIFTGFSMVFRRRLLDVIPWQNRFMGSNNNSIAHDRWVFFLAHVLGRTVELAEPLVFYRQHAANVYGVKSKPMLGPAQGVEAVLHYVAAASWQMASLVDQMPPWAEEVFPAFDRARARQIYATEAANFEARGAVYRSPRARALGIWFGAMLAGRYRQPINGRLRWRSILKDALHIVLR